jgi:hypothetical protein
VLPERAAGYCHQASGLPPVRPPAPQLQVRIRNPAIPDSQFHNPNPGGALEETRHRHSCHRRPRAVLAAAATYQYLHASTDPHQSDLQSKLHVVEKTLSETQQDLLGYTTFTQYLEVTKKAISGRTKFLAARIDRNYVHVEHINRSALGIKSDATIILNYAVEYSVGYDLSPESFSVSGDATGITVTLKKPELVASPAIGAISHEIPGKGLLIDEKEQVIALQQQLTIAAEKQGDAISMEEAVIALCERKARGIPARLPGEAAECPRRPDDHVRVSLSSRSTEHRSTEHHRAAPSQHRSTHQLVLTPPSSPFHSGRAFFFVHERSSKCHSPSPISFQLIIAPQAAVTTALPTNRIPCPPRRRPMLVLRDPEATRSIAAPEIRRLVEQRFLDICDGEPYEPDLHGYMIVVEAGDSVQDLEEESGCPLSLTSKSWRNWTPATKWSSSPATAISAS